MILNEILNDARISQYRLSKDTGIGQATISDMCSGKTSLEKCSAGTVYRLAKYFDLTVEYLLEGERERKDSSKTEHRPTFDVYKSNICHYVKDKGDMDFIIETLETDEIRTLYNKKWYPECLYLLAMVDYISREHDLPQCENYNDLRSMKLEKPIYPMGVIMQAKAAKDDSIKDRAYENAIPEFKRFNIVENEVRNVV